MNDGLEDILSDPTGLSGLSSSDDETATETADTATQATEAAPIDDPDEDYSVEQVEEKLREEWGPDYDQKYEDASKAVAQFFKGDDPGLQWFARRIGNHPMAVKLGLRLAAIYAGHGMPTAPSPAPAVSHALDAALKDFEPGGRHYDRWLSGDENLNRRRIELYRRRFPGSVQID